MKSNLKLQLLACFFASFLLSEKAYSQYEAVYTPSSPKAAQCNPYGQLLYYAGSQYNPANNGVPNYAFGQTRTFPTSCKDVNSMNSAIKKAAPAKSAMTLTPETPNAPATGNSIAGTSPQATNNGAITTLHETILTQALTEVSNTGTASCLKQVSNLNHSSCPIPNLFPKNADANISIAPVAINSCSSKVSVPGSHFYASEFLEKIVDAPKEVPPAMYGLSSDMSASALLGGGQAMYVSKSTDGGKNWTKVAKIGADKFDSVRDGLYNSLSVSADGSSMVFTTQKGAFPITKMGDQYNVNNQAVDPVSANQSAASDVALSPDQTQMAVSYTGYDAHWDYDKAGKKTIYHDAVPSEIVNYHKENGTWVKDKTASVPNSGGGVLLKLVYDPNGKLYVGTGEQAYALDAGSNVFSKVAIKLPSKVTSKKTGKTTTVLAQVSNVSVYGMTFSESKDGSGKSQYTPDLAATCWGVFDLQSHTISKGRAYDIQANPKDPNQIIRTTSLGADFSADGGKTWKKVGGLPDCESTTSPGTFYTTANAGCADVLTRKAGSNSSSIKKDPNMYPSEFRTAHFNSDGSVLISGTSGTFLTTPFSGNCP